MLAQALDARTWDYLGARDPGPRIPGLPGPWAPRPGTFGPGTPDAGPLDSPCRCPCSRTPAALRPGRGQSTRDSGLDFPPFPSHTCEVGATMNHRRVVSSLMGKLINRKRLTYSTPNKGVTGDPSK